jgi:GNAT superfamily N-acetyltransferase
VESHSIGIRPLEASDVALFRDLRTYALRCDPDAFGQTLESALAMNESDWRDRLRSALESGAILVAESRGLPVGMCGVGSDAGDPQTGWLWGMFVVPSSRRSGAGDLLLRAGEQWCACAARGYQTIRALVAAPNQTAIHFYRNRGYAIGAETGVLRPGSEIPVYPISKRLAS